MESNKEKKNEKKLIIFEFFSGIGGMHDALSQIDNIKIVDIFPFDINQNANKVYEHNFAKKVFEITIESFTIDNYEQICSNFNLEEIIILWTMSPPCQPFTRQGNQEGLNDNRTNAFKHLMNLLNKTKYQPDYFLLENVKNFEVSEANKMLIKVLQDNNYSYLQFLLSPIQFNIPNSRLRFYLIARNNKLESLSKKAEGDRNAIITSTDLFKNEILESKEIKDFINYEVDQEESYKQYYLSKALLNKDSSRAMDIVTLESKSSNCFTKNYSRLIKGSGSILLLDSSLYQKNMDLKAMEHKLRYFSPNEILKLLCFSSSFSIPSSLSTKMQYRLLGNSINVKVVNILLKFLL